MVYLSVIIYDLLFNYMFINIYLFILFIYWQKYKHFII